MGYSEQFADADVAKMVLVDEGLDVEAAAKVLALDPTVVERLAPKVAERRAALDTEMEEAEKAAKANSPEGRATAAKEALRRQAERLEMVQGGSALLAEAGVESDGLSEIEILHHSGIEPRQELMSVEERDAVALADPEYQRRVAVESLDTQWNALSEDVRRERCEELGLDYAEAVAEKERESWAAVGLKPPSERGGDDGGDEGGSE